MNDEDQHVSVNDYKLIENRIRRMIRVSKRYSYANFITLTFFSSC